jgi:uncharacterized phage-like protein YoqJ
MIVAFTGHRPDEIGGYELPNLTYIHVCQQIEKTLKELKPEKVISGMALGVDQWAAHIAYRLNIPFVAAMPFVGQDSVWNEESKKVFQALLKKASEQVIVSEGGYTAAKMQIRNEYMVDHCDVLVAVYNGDPTGGTANCVKYAQGIGKKIVYIDPNPKQA